MLEELKVARVRRRLSQWDLATAAGLTENRYWRIENGRVPPTTDEAAALARALDTTPEALFPGLAPQPNEATQ